MASSFDPDSAFAALRNIRTEFGEFLLQTEHPTEADTRANLIDRMLTEVCGWPDEMIRRESHVQLLVFAIYQLTSHATLDQRSSLSAVTLAFVAAIVAYAFKLSQQGWYGFGEVIVGILVAYSSFSDGKGFQPPSLSNILPLLGAIYIIVRGFSNSIDGYLGKVTNMVELAEKISKKMDQQAPAIAFSNLQDPQAPHTPPLGESFDSWPYSRIRG